MKYIWDEPSYRWFRESSEYTGYDRKLADILLEKMTDISNSKMHSATVNLSKEQTGHAPLENMKKNEGMESIKFLGTLCDMGCGAGQVDLVLSPYFDKITCVDIDKDVISRLSATISEEGYSNLEAVCAGGVTITQHFDRVMAIYHARDITRVLKYLELADKQLILVVRASRMTEVGIGQYRKLDCFESASMKQALDEAGIKYDFSSYQLEHGQPFRNYEDARAFVKLYCEMQDDEAADEYCRVRLQETGEDEFPYYLPKTKNMGVFVINK